ncbi:hypothetical protein EYF80_009943 [Liparis tanakae]|uniref:Uncharacterized protein n=1 Tax=Liparis tanakae TaxID=230148 RepID=A0A4Z2IPW2_9TELE|nr:hypothetical protein EYF80_009943 [Liparis tanakae]
MMRMYRATIGGSNRLVLVLSLSRLPTNAFKEKEEELEHTVNVRPSRLKATLKTLMNSDDPIRLAPCVTMPVKRITLGILIWEQKERERGRREKEGEK